jgi:hypothetical protein
MLQEPLHRIRILDYVEIIGFNNNVCYVLVKYECIESHMRRRSLTHESVSETARTRLPHRAPRTHPAPPGGQLDNTDTHTQQLFPRRYIIDKMHVTA